MRKCKAIGGIHWDEIYIKKDIKVCARTNQLVGYEDLEIPENILEVINMDKKSPKKLMDTKYFKAVIVTIPRLMNSPHAMKQMKN